MTVTDISRKIEAHQRNEQSDWERARLVSYFAVMPHIDSKKGNMTMQKMIPFPWDESAKPKRPRKLTEADKKWLDDMDRLMKKRHGKRNN